MTVPSARLATPGFPTALRCSQFKSASTPQLRRARAAGCAGRRRPRDAPRPARSARSPRAPVRRRRPAGAHRPPTRCPGAQRRRRDRQREPERQPDAERQAPQATPHRATGGSKRYPTPQTVTSSCGRGVGLELLAQLAHVDRRRRCDRPTIPTALEELLARRAPGAGGRRTRAAARARARSGAPGGRRARPRARPGRSSARRSAASPARQRCRCRRAAQHGLHARDDLGGCGRLDDVVVGAEPEAAQLVAVLAARAEEQQRDVGVTPGCAGRARSPSRPGASRRASTQSTCCASSASTRRPRRRR